MSSSRALPLIVVRTPNSPGVFYCFHSERLSRDEKHFVVNGDRIDVGANAIIHIRGRPPRFVYCDKTERFLLAPCPPGDNSHYTLLFLARDRTYAETPGFCFDKASSILFIDQHSPMRIYDPYRYHTTWIDAANISIVSEKPTDAEVLARTLPNQRKTPRALGFLVFSPQLGVFTEMYTNEGCYLTKSMEHELDAIENRMYAKRPKTTARLDRNTDRLARLREALPKVRAMPLLSAVENYVIADVVKTQTITYAECQSNLEMGRSIGAFREKARDYVFTFDANGKETLDALHKLLV